MPIITPALSAISTAAAPYLVWLRVAAVAIPLLVAGYLGYRLSAALDAAALARADAAYQARIAAEQAQQAMAAQQALAAIQAQDAANQAALAAAQQAAQQQAAESAATIEGLKNEIASGAVRDLGIDPVTARYLSGLRQHGSGRVRSHSAGGAAAPGPGPLAVPAPAGSP